MFDLVIIQILKAFVYYVAIVFLLRSAGKRLAGQTTTFDLIILITLGVVIQNAVLEPGALNAFIFVLTVFLSHKLLALLCAKYDTVRHLVRGKPRILVREGEILERALEKEDMSKEELLAGLRKLGHDNISDIRLATLEETGQISAVTRE